MTPIKEIWVIGKSIVFIDMAGRLNTIAEAIDDPTALLLADLLAEYHDRPLFEFDTELRAMKPRDRN